jgi:hypothetical protein
MHCEYLINTTTHRRGSSWFQNLGHLAATHCNTQMEVFLQCLSLLHPTDNTYKRKGLAYAAPVWPSTVGKTLKASTP